MRCIRYRSLKANGFSMDQSISFMTDWVGNAAAMLEVRATTISQLIAFLSDN